MLRSHILFSSETSQAFLINEYTERVNAVDERVNSQIEFQSIDQIGLAQVPLGHILIALLQIHILEASDQENSFALTEMNRFHNEGLVILFLVKLRAEVIHFLWEDPRLGEKVKFAGECLMHPH